MTLVAIIPRHLRRKWDALALPQLCSELLRQDAENERLKQLDGDADYWYEQAMSMQDILANEHDLERGLTLAGDLTLIPKVSTAPDGSRHPSAMQATGAALSPLPRSVCREWSPPQGNADGDALELDNATAVQALTASESL